MTQPPGSDHGSSLAHAPVPQSFFPAFPGSLRSAPRAYLPRSAVIELPGLRRRSIQRVKNISCFSRALAYNLRVSCRGLRAFCGFMPFLRVQPPARDRRASRSHHSSGEALPPRKTERR